jgi:hypothetical protein
MGPQEIGETVLRSADGRPGARNDIARRQPVPPIRQTACDADPDHRCHKTKFEGYLLTAAGRALNCLFALDRGVALIFSTAYPKTLAGAAAMPRRTAVRLPELPPRNTSRRGNVVATIPNRGPAGLSTLPLLRSAMSAPT